MAQGHGRRHGEQLPPAARSAGGGAGRGGVQSGQAEPAHMAAQHRGKRRRPSMNSSMAAVATP